ncbi:MAG: type I glyceraldehyde-3-phosphate dehydrogenase [Planktomarina sp.]
MTVTVAINGFGRIGRNIMRAVMESGRTDIEVVAINDLGPVDTNAHLLKYDSVHGRANFDVTVKGNSIDVGRGAMDVTALRNPADLPWKDVDVVLECTGVFKSKEQCEAHLENGSSRVLISAPGKNVDNTIVCGVNDHTLTSDHIVVSNASCTTNCLAPIAKVLHENIGIKRGLMTTVHAYTGDQPTLDRMHSDLYRARAAGMSMIPTTTGAAKAVGLVLPALAGKLDGVAIRVPTPNVSTVDLTIEAGRATSKEEIDALMKEASNGALKGILGYTDEKLVSQDFNHDPHSSTYASDQTLVMDGDMVRVLAWYDNEWGFSNRMCDTAVAMGKLI